LTAERISAGAAIGAAAAVAVDASIAVFLRPTDERTSDEAGAAADQSAVRAAHGSADGSTAETAYGGALLGLRASGERRMRRTAAMVPFFILDVLSTVV
jgi:hypothetical protein